MNIKDITSIKIDILEVPVLLELLEKILKNHEKRDIRENTLVHKGHVEMLETIINLIKRKLKKKYFRCQKMKFYGTNGIRN